MQFTSPLSFANKVLNRYELQMKRVRLTSRPVELTLEPTLLCNSNCVMCNRNYSRKETKEAAGFLSWEIFRKAEPFFKYASRVLFGGFGEAFLHPEYLQMLGEIKKSRTSVYVFTNGILLTEEVGRRLVDLQMDMVCVSLGGASRETYRKIRGVDALDTVAANLRAISEYKRAKGARKPLLSFNIVAMKSLLPELEHIVLLARDAGVELIAFPNLVVQGAEMRSESLWLNPEPAERAFAHAAGLAKFLGIEFVSPKFCISRSGCIDPFRRMNVNWDGTVMSCAMERYLVGDLTEQSIGEIWNGTGLIALRRRLHDDGVERVCPNCTCWDNSPEAFLNPWVNSRAFAERAVSGG
jgi:MoaA/NifB/PqqE/SkfB family radical SAM enzyme